MAVTSVFLDDTILVQLLRSDFGALAKTRQDTEAEVLAVIPGGGIGMPEGAVFWFVPGVCGTYVCLLCCWGLLVPPGRGMVSRFLIAVCRRSAHDDMSSDTRMADTVSNWCLHVV